MDYTGLVMFIGFVADNLFGVFIFLCLWLAGVWLASWR